MDEPQNQENVQPNKSLYNWRHFEVELETWSPTWVILKMYNDQIQRDKLNGVIEVDPKV